MKMVVFIDSLACKIHNKLGEDPRFAQNEDPK